MANALISLLDITKRKGNDQAVGLLEDTLTYAPELSTVMGRPIVGTQYKTCHRKLPTVSFRKANEGSATVKGEYRQALKECMILDGQIQVDQMVANAEAAGNGPEGSIGDVLVDEAQGVIMASYITVGSQMYYGTSSDANGFVGINALTGSLNAAKNENPAVVSATGSTAVTQSSAYLLWENTKGAHFIFGNNTGLTMLPEWRLQQVSDDNGKKYMAFVNNFAGWIGFAVNHPNSVGRICNIRLATDNKPLTDKLVAELISYMPLQMLAEVVANVNAGGPKSWGPGLKMFINPAVGYSLQQSRTQVTGVNAIDAAAPFPTLPTSSNGIPIIYTDSIVNTEAVVT